MIICPGCGFENPDTADVCESCGSCGLWISDRVIILHPDFENGIPEWGSPRFNQRTLLVLGINGEVRTMVFDVDQITRLTFGRRDPHINYIPDVDLEPYEALDRGVSRKHAVFINKDGLLQIMDTDSKNGTYLNGRKLVPHQSRVIRDGDDIRLGHLVVRVRFQDKFSETEIDAEESEIGEAHVTVRRLQRPLRALWRALVQAYRRWLVHDVPQQR